MKNSTREVRSFSDLELEKITQGSEKLDSGVFSTVYEGPSPDTVLKVGNDMGDGWLIWALYVMRTQAETHHNHLPIIQTVHINFKSKKFIALMERLTPYSGMVFSNQNVVQNNYLSNISDETFLRLPDNMGIPLKYYLQECAKMYSTLKAELNIDMHGGNMMLRGITPVITDPLSFLVPPFSKRTAKVSGKNIEKYVTSTDLPKGFTYEK